MGQRRGGRRRAANLMALAGAESGCARRVAKTPGGPRRFSASFRTPAKKDRMGGSCERRPTVPQSFNAGGARRPAARLGDRGKRRCSPTRGRSSARRSWARNCARPRRAPPSSRAPPASSAAARRRRRRRCCRPTCSTQATASGQDLCRPRGGSRAFVPDVMRAAALGARIRKASLVGPPITLALTPSAPTRSQVANCDALFALRRGHAATPTFDSPMGSPASRCPRRVAPPTARSA